MKPYQVVFFGFLLGLIILSGFSFPTIFNSIRFEEAATPTPAPNQSADQLTLESGDTTGLMIGAVVIVIIILAGVWISRSTIFPQ